MIRPADLTGDAHFWLGRLSAALAVADKHPTVAREALQDYIKSPVVAPAEAEKLREALKGRTPK